MDNSDLDNSEYTSDDETSLVIDNKTEQTIDDINDTSELPALREYKGRTYTIEIAAGAILGGLSVLIGFLWDAYVEGILGGPQFAPGMTWVDLLAVPILVAFFVFGIRSGLIACVIGCGAIAGYLSEGGFGWLAMLPKFVATITMFLVPWIILKINTNRKAKNKFRILKALDYSSETFNSVGNYAFLMGNAILFRMIFTFIFNLFVIIPLYFYLVYGGETFETVFTQPILFLTLVGGYTAWNIVQGVTDSIISYLITYPTRLYKVFSTW